MPNRLFVQLWKRSQKVSRCIWLPEKKVLARAEAFAAQQKEKYREAIACGRHFPVTVFEAETDDAWARDMAPTFVKKGRQRSCSKLVFQCLGRNGGWAVCILEAG